MPRSLAPVKSLPMSSGSRCDEGPQVLAASLYAESPFQDFAAEIFGRTSLGIATALVSENRLFTLPTKQFESNCMFVASAKSYEASPRIITTLLKKVAPSA